MSTAPNSPWSSPGVHTPDHTPVVFVPGNVRDASDFDPIAEYLIEQGYPPESLWAITFAQSTPTHGEMAAQLEETVTSIQAQTGAEQIDVIGHSLGVTGARYWMDQYGRHETVSTFVGLAGANHGLEMCRLADTLGLHTGRFRIANFLRSDYQQFADHPLAALNANPTPDTTDWYTIRGANDLLFATDPYSPMLEGATNEVVSAGHHGVRTCTESHELIHSWLTD